MFTLAITFLIYSTATFAQPYNATDHFLVDCGTSNSGQRWDADENSKFVPSDTDTTSISKKTSSPHPSVPTIPYSTARIFTTSSFTYTFPMSQGPKFLRLHFFPATYSNFDTKQSFFSVSSSDYSLLTNFSAFLHLSFQENYLSDSKVVVKEFLIYVKYTKFLTLTFTPSPNSYAFVNGIEIVSMPENLYFNARPKPVDMITGPGIFNYIALENVYRLNMGGAQISENTGMYRSWDQDDNYIFPKSVIGRTPVYNTAITYTPEIPSYTAPEQVYATQRSMGNVSKTYNPTWILPVDSGFYYMLRLHFCNIIPQYTKQGQVRFQIFINNQPTGDMADLFEWTKGSGYPIFKDYVVFVNSPDGRPSKQDLWLALHPNIRHNESYVDAYLNGLEAFKLSMVGNLSSPNPQVRSANPLQNNKKNQGYATIIGSVVGGLVLLTVLILVLIWKYKRMKQSSTTHNDNPSLESEDCRHFTLKEVKAATNKFNENGVIGRGGFGKVYIGNIDKSTKLVAIKRFSPSSKQGFQEFKTEIQLLSKLRHDHLVSLIGYCDEKKEMILVYDYMVNGTLREHLYNTNNPPLSWKTRLGISIGAAKGLHYLHTCEKRTIIHRDVKSTNILLDENWVAKVSDFGLSKIGSEDPLDTHTTTLVKGSIGYIDPEYRKTQKLRQKSDVYSFGVVLFEVLCARPVIDPWVSGEQVSLAEWGKICYQRGTLIEISDPNISGEVAVECLRKFGKVANSCLQDEGSARPAMEEVVRGLECALHLQIAAEEMHSDGIQDEGILNNGESEKSQIMESSTSLSS